MSINRTLKSLGVNKYNPSNIESVININNDKAIIARLRLSST